MDKLKKKNGGITLIALVITIIVLLILAAVSIATLTGQNGILTRASDAKISNENAQVYESMILKISDNIVDTQTGRDTRATLDYLLDNNYIDSNNVVDADRVTDNTLQTGKGSLEEGDVYFIKQTENGLYGLFYKNAQKEDISLGNIFQGVTEAVGLEYLQISNEGVVSLKPEYSYYGTGIETGNIDLITELSIPEYIDGIKVTKIASDAFTRCKNLKSITFPNTLTEIGSTAFYECTSLESVTIPGSVETIYGSSFKHCSALKSFTMLEGVKNINGIFSECDNLSDIIFPSSIEALSGRAFEDTAWFKNQNDGLIYVNNILYAYKGDMQPNTSIEVKENTKYISDSAFSGCYNLININIPNSVEYIGSYAFESCTNLKNITIPNSLTEIKYCTFKGCINLESITIPGNIVEIGFSAFSECTNLKNVTMLNGVKNIGDNVFENCTQLNNIIFPDSIESVSKNAFQNTAWYNSQSDGCIYINNILYQYKGEMPANTTIEVRENTKQISTEAFYECRNLIGIEIPSTVEEIGSAAFYKCTRLTEINLPDGVKYIGESAFSQCENLANVSMPDTIETIGHGAFNPMCYDLYEINYAGTKEQWNNIELGDSVFLNDVVIHCSDGDIDIK